MEQEISGISKFPEKIQRLSTIFKTNFQKRSVLFDFVPEFPEILVKWIVPFISQVTLRKNQIS